MMVEGWMIVGSVLFFLAAFLTAYLGAVAAQMSLRRLVTSLEYAVADLESRVLREVKLRASAAGVKAKKQDEELLEQLAQQPQKSSDPWWMKMVHPDLRQS